MRKQLAVFFLLCGLGIALAQSSGTVANHAAAIGRGPGVSGFGSAAPGTAGWVLTSNGASSDPTFQASSAGTGTVTSVAFTVPAASIFTMTGSPITSSGTLALTTAGTSGGIPYFSSASVISSSAALTANLPVIGGGAGAAPAVGTRSGNTTAYVTTTGTQTSGRCVQIDANGNHVAASGSCNVSSGITVGSTTVNSGTTTKVLYDNAGVLGEYTVTGSGNVVMSAGPTFTGTVTAALISATTYNKWTLTAPATGITLTGTDNAVYTMPSATTTVAGLGVANAFTAANSFSGVTTWTGSLIVPIRVITAAGAVTVSATTDYFVCVNKTSGAATTVNLPAAPTAGYTALIKDCKGDSATNAITVQSADAKTIDGAATKTINTAYGSSAYTYNGTQWNAN